MTVKHVFEPEVTEQDWLDLEGSDPWAVWRSMPCPDDGPNRKELLLVAHLVRQVMDQMTDPSFVAAIDAGEKFADGLLSENHMWEAHKQAYAVWDSVAQPHEAAQEAANVARRFLYSQGETAEMMIGAAASRAAHLAEGQGQEPEIVRHQAAEAMLSLIRRLINEVHGNPFRPVTVHPAWQTITVVGLAQAIYDERDFDRMPILGDALEEAGCTDAEVLKHCRQPGEHIRGCWVVDLILNKS
jgi:hypothetical protein